MFWYDLKLFFFFFLTQKSKSVRKCPRHKKHPMVRNVFTNKLESWASSFFQWSHVHHGPIYQENSSTEYSEGQWTRRTLQDALLSVLIGETLSVYICLYLSLPFCACMFDYMWLVIELLEEKISLNFFCDRIIIDQLNIIWEFYFISSEEKYVFFFFFPWVVKL